MWPSVKEDCVVDLNGQEISVPAGNWDAPGLAAYLTSQNNAGISTTGTFDTLNQTIVVASFTGIISGMTVTGTGIAPGTTVTATPTTTTVSISAFPISNQVNQSLVFKTTQTTITYDYAQLRFLFSPAAIIGPGTTNWGIVGFPVPPPLYNLVTESPLPVQLSGPTRIHVNTNLALYTVPPSGRLGTIPVTVNYGELLSYFDESGTEPSLCMEQHIDHLDVQLLDENNNELEGYEEIPWGMIISIVPVINEGFESVPFIQKEDGTIVQEDAAV